ncbi:MAG: DUF2071 domain-containing protein [Pedosphaera sp.]|nr:DUF2071 domain-containing protein [Pedosphaera sp.]
MDWLLLLPAIGKRMRRTPTLQDRLALREKPSQPAIMFQTWGDLLFLHWEYDADQVQRTLPPGLYVDTFAGRAFLGVIPFFMKNVRPSFLPSIPGLSNFLQLNVRTYVYDDTGKPGVWFYSLDCNLPLAVWGARKFFFLPYFHAELAARVETGSMNYTSRRQGTHEDRTTQIHYTPGTAPSEAQPESLEFFLIERYVLFSFATARRALYSVRVYHTPYRLASARLEEYDTTVLGLDGFSVPANAPAHVVFSPGVDVSIYGLERCGDARG